MGKFKWAVVLAAILILPCITFAVPQLINYQGELSDSSGNPVNGDVSITFTIYNASTGGDVLWTETQTVTVTDGMFNVLLGSQTSLLANTFDGNERYLGVKIGVDPEMTPRQRLVSVPFAYRAACIPGDSLNCYTGDPATKGVGVCKSGIRTCGPDGVFGTCEEEVTPVTEVCSDGLDNDCDGQVDEDCAVDLDADGYDDGVDCNDSASSCTTDCVTDSDADGIADCLDLCIDTDFDDHGTDNANVVVGAGAYEVGSCTIDGVTACSFGDAVCVSPDCNDSLSSCTTDCETDIDFDGTADCQDTCIDGDFDGYGTAGGGGNTCIDLDCNDTDTTAKPGAAELCDGILNDCNGAMMPEESDDDGDTYVECSIDGGGWDGNPAITGGDDCNDVAFAINPGEIEVVGDGIDQDCDGGDTCYQDLDDDGYGTAVLVNDDDLDCDNASVPSTSSVSGDCNDGDNGVYPGSGC
jgi:hypothetical protein